jgi:hypothetical protein
MMTPIGLSTWTDFGGPFGSPTPPCLRVHVARAGDGTLVDEDTGARYFLGLPDGIDRTFMSLTGAMSDDTSEAGAAAWIAGGMRGFRAVRVPVDVSAGEAHLRLEIEGRDPIRFTSRWRKEKQPEPARAEPKRRRKAARS